MIGTTVRCDLDHFGDRELNLIYIAKRLNDALRLEKLLTDAGVDYVVEPDRYMGGIIFQSERVGAFFYVASETEEAARRAMLGARFRPYVAGS